MCGVEFDAGEDPESHMTSTPIPPDSDPSTQSEEADTAVDPEQTSDTPQDRRGDASVAPFDPPPEPLSTRDIQQIVVESTDSEPTEEELRTLGDTQKVALDRPLRKRLASGINRVEVLPDAASEPSSVRDLEALIGSLPGPDEPCAASSTPDLASLVARWPGSDSEPVSASEIGAVLTDDDQEEPLSLRDIEEDLTAQIRPTGGTPVMKKRTVPPPLPSRQMPGLTDPTLVSPTATVAKRVDGDALARVMMERLLEGDFEGALLAAGTMLRVDPKDPEALQAAQMSRVELFRKYDGRLGSRARVPRLLVPTDALHVYPLDTPSALVLSQVDGKRTVDDIVEGGILPKLDALRTLSELYLRGIVGVSGEGT